MCGIIGYTGVQNAKAILMEGLSNLEYRGYDSAGISVFENGAIRTIKTKGRLQDLADKLERKGIAFAGHCGIGHTRWATHGVPSKMNSHPHCTQQVALVHNGIIENYLQIRTFLLEQGYEFISETDTETAANLIDYFYRETDEPVSAITKALERIEGAFAFGILFADRPDTVYGVRKDSPLIVGLGTDGNFIASDVPAILAHTRDYYLIDELEIAVVKPDGVMVLDLTGRAVQKQRHTADWNIEQAQKGGFAHFMLKEIHEQPQALMSTLHPRIKNGMPYFMNELPDDFFTRYQKLHVVACGTAMHAGTVGKSVVEQFARIPVEVDLASEFRYRNPILPENTLVVAVSQSGETADTLAALRLAKQRGGDTLAIVNVTGSSIAREAQYVLHTHAGPEISVASTKAFSVQIGLIYLLALAFAQATGTMTEDQVRRGVEQLMLAVDTTERIMVHSDRLKEMAPRYRETASLFYIGRGVDHALAMEGSLKLKEISYIHSEAYAAGELKHGTISLITEGVPVVALVTQRDLVPKIVSNIQAVRSRGANVLVIAQEGMEIDRDAYDELIELPAVDDAFMPILSVIILQLFAYHIAVARGCDVDKPRNLAKSVTVE